MYAIRSYYVIGFSGSPWTLATYMVEGGSSKTFTLIKQMLYREPALLHALLDKLTDSVILYLNAQVAAGAQALMLFDTWGGVLRITSYNVCYTKLLRISSQKDLLSWVLHFWAILKYNLLARISISRQELRIAFNESLVILSYNFV